MAVCQYWKQDNPQEWFIFHLAQLITQQVSFVSCLQFVVSCVSRFNSDGSVAATFCLRVLGRGRRTSARILTTDPCVPNRKWDQTDSPSLLCLSTFHESCKMVAWHKIGRMACGRQGEDDLQLSAGQFWNVLFVRSRQFLIGFAVGCWQVGALTLAVWKEWSNLHALGQSTSCNLAHPLSCDH